MAINVKREADARQVVDPGTICFWVEGSLLALPFGPTPISCGNECRLITKVNVFSHFEGDAQLLETVKDGDKIRVESANSAAAQHSSAKFLLDVGTLSVRQPHAIDATRKHCYKSIRI